MDRIVLIAVLALTAIHCYGAVQVQMPETAELQLPNDDLQAQIKELERNMSEIWTYIHQLRTAVSEHLTHLRQHQVELESSVHRMEHFHEDSHAHTDGGSHHHSGEDHSHSGEHSHGSEQHSHGDDHGSDHHSHSGEHHSHSSEHHSHSGEHHSHSGEHHSHSYSHSHSHGAHDHGKEDGSDHHDHDHHHHDHKDSHETEDLTQQTQQTGQPVAEPVVEPVIAATNVHDRYHHHHHQGQPQASRGGDASGLNLINENSFHSHHHHHHHHGTSTSTSSSSSRNRTVVLPRYSEYDLYDYAVCNVQPNRAIPEEQQQDVEGRVVLWQKKSGGPLNLHVQLRGFKIGDHHAHHGAQQTIQTEEDNETPQEAGHRHGFHVHTSGDLSNGCQSTGPHYNPKGMNHGAPTALVRHVGDLGSIECDEHGITNILISDDIASLRGQYSILGKSLVIHANQDDLGLGGDDESLRTGNAGTRIACCVIQKVEKLNIRYYKAMKTATQYKNY